TGTARRAATPSRAAPPPSSRGSTAPTAKWSACRSATSPACWPTWAGAEMRHRIFIAVTDGALEVFRWSDGRLAQAIREMPETRPLAGAVFLGKVAKLEPSLQAAFVEIGLDRPGLLPLKKQGKQPNEGESVVVQVRRDERDGKGVRLSSSIQSETAYADKLAKATAPACLVPPPSAWQS